MSVFREAGKSWSIGSNIYHMLTVKPGRHRSAGLLYSEVGSGGKYV